MRGDVGFELALRVQLAVMQAFDLDVSVAETAIRLSAPERSSDYQCNAAMALAKQVGRSSREVATAIVDVLDVSDLVESVTVDGPGFISMTLRQQWLEQHLSSLADDSRGGAPVIDEPRSFVVDYSSPNVAKEMHVGHLRPTIIGDAIVRILEFCGHTVTRRNHAGDWGTQFGMLIEHLIDLGYVTSGLAIDDLNRFYQQARSKFDTDDDFANRSRQRVVALQSGDEQTLELWRTLVTESKRHFAQVYELLGVLLTDDDYYGESFYNPYLVGTVKELEHKGLTTVSDGALCVFPKGFTGREGDPLPLIVRKSDGGYNYTTTDLAAVRYWTQERGQTDLVYVVGAPQRLHFQMIFAASTETGWLGERARAIHVSFGSVLGPGGKVFRTRAGETIKLIDLLTEAIDRAANMLKDRNEVSADNEPDVARAVGLGAVKYADLSSDRDRDYTFNWNRMLAMDGNTSVYLQYANARIQSVLRKAESKADTTSPIRITHPAERALGLKITQFPAAIDAAATTYHPHKICTYLYELAQEFSRFFETCPILQADTEQQRASRLQLAKITSRILTIGLHLLGIQAPSRL